MFVKVSEWNNYVWRVDECIIEKFQAGKEKCGDEIEIEREKLGDNISVEYMKFVDTELRTHSTFPHLPEARQGKYLLKEEKCISGSRALYGGG